MAETKRSGPAAHEAAPLPTTDTAQDTDRCDTLTGVAHAAEAAVLGAMLLDADARHGVPSMLDPDSFDREAHRTVYGAVLAVLEDGDTPDPLTVTAKLAERGRLDEVGGPVAVSDLSSMAVCPVPASWPAYATVVAREARRRRGIVTLRVALDRLERGEDPEVVAWGLRGKVARSGLCGEVGR